MGRAEPCAFAAGGGFGDSSSATLKAFSWDGSHLHRRNDAILFLRQARSHRGRAPADGSVSLAHSGRRCGSGCARFPVAGGIFDVSHAEFGLYERPV
jgi:hypothetical protein